MFKGLGLGLYNARKGFLWFVPSPAQLLVPKLRKIYQTCDGVLGLFTAVRNVEATGWAGMAGELIGDEITSSIKHSVKHTVQRRLLTVQKETRESIPLNRRHLFEPKRSWFTGSERMRFTVVYHDAYKAGAHLDIHFGNGVSIVMNLRNKPVLDEIKYHRGQLTQASKKALVKHIKEELTDSVRVRKAKIRNWDHDTECAQMVWNKNEEPMLKGDYGSGIARQIVISDEAQVLLIKPGDGKSTRLYIPCIEPDRLIRMHMLKFKEGEHDKKPGTPMVLIATDMTPPPTFLEKPKLKKYMGEDMEKFLEKTDRANDTLKYDGASCHGITGPEGTRIYSPRESTVTGVNAEYTGKIPAIATVTAEHPIKWMGELLTYKDGKVLPSEVTAGHLNREELMSRDIDVKIKVYRIDTWGKQHGVLMNYIDNRILQVVLCKLMPSCVSVVEKKTAQDADKDGDEGVISVPKDGNLWEGCKLKFRDEPLDLFIKEVRFKHGASSTPEHPKIAGELLCKDENGKEYKIGPGQLGNRDLCMSVIDHPKKYIGRCGEFLGLRGHKGRSLKFKKWHQDKGKS